MGTIITISLLGKFQITEEENNAILNENNIRSDMLTRLFVYLVMHREHPLSVQELTEALWNEKETNNPAGALKNLMYRLRTLLDKKFGHQEFILTTRGAYQWNERISILVDAEIFEYSGEEARREKTQQKQITLYEKALEWYQGDFMPQLDCHWAITMSAYYHSLYLNMVNELTDLYKKAHRFDRMEYLGIQALKYDSADEQIYCNLITALIRQGKLSLAMEYYETAEKNLYSFLGVSNLTKLHALHEELLKMKKGKQAESVQEIREEISEKNQPDGAYICGYPVFREIYRLEARRSARMKDKNYMLLLTLSLIEEQCKAMNQQTKDFLISQAMGVLEKVMKDNLRIGDLACRYSDSQFLVLLSSYSYEGNLLVRSRLVTKFQESTNRRVHLETDIQEITIFLKK